MKLIDCWSFILGCKATKTKSLLLAPARDTDKEGTYTNVTNVDDTYGD